MLVVEMRDEFLEVLKGSLAVRTEVALLTRRGGLVPPEVDGLQMLFDCDVFHVVSGTGQVWPLTQFFYFLFYPVKK